jgi:hypothetical protein
MKRVIGQRSRGKRETARLYMHSDSRGAMYIEEIVAFVRWFFYMRVGIFCGSYLFSSSLPFFLLGETYIFPPSFLSRATASFTSLPRRVLFSLD